MADVIPSTTTGDWWIKVGQVANVCVCNEECVAQIEITR